MTILLTCFLAVVGAVVVLALRLRHQQRLGETTARLRLAAQEAEDAAIRRLRLAAHDLRGLGMTLQGHADHLTAVEHPQAAGIATAAADLLDMADDLQDHTVQAGDARVLRDQQVALADAINDAIATVAAGISPGRRQWRLPVQFHGVELRADPRALRHMLTRVLADAVRSTRQDDFIDISVEVLPGGLAVVIADEGTGSATPEAGAQARDSRGIGLRLMLARALMAAHGGRVEVEARSGVGTRVSLVFPEARVRRPAPLEQFSAK